MKNLKYILISSFLILNFCFTGCYSWYQGKIALDTETQQTNLTDFFYEEKEITSLEAPAQVIASQGLYKGTVKLRWSEVENASSYRIERAVVQPDSTGVYAVPEEGDFSVVEKYVYSTTYDDQIINSVQDSTNYDEYNYRYYYRVCAENINKGYESSEYTSITNKDTAASGWLLKPPLNIDASKGKSTEKIDVSWSAVPGAVSYIIYRGKSAKGLGMEQLATVRSTQISYTDEITDENDKGVEFYYKVCAVLSNGSYSAYSSLALGYSLEEGAPVAPESVKVVDGYGTSTSGITISWDETSVTVADPSTTTLTFSVYRTSSTDSSYTLLFQNLDSTRNTVIDTTSLKPGVYYYYYVQSVFEKDGVKSKSSFSKTGPEDETPAVGFLLSCPQNVELAETSSNSTIYVRWTPSIGYEEPYNQEYLYNIYSDTEQKGDYSTVVQQNLSLTLGDDGYYELEVPKANFFKVSATNNSNGAESAKSTAVAPTPDAPTNVVASKTSSLGGLDKFTYNSNEVYPVKITWSAPSTDKPYGYNIYRSTKKDSSFRKLNDTPITDEIYSYIDENETARAGTYYYYKVVSVNSLGQGKKGNNPETDTANNCRGYGAITKDQWFREYNKSIMRSQAKLTLMHKPNDMDKLGSETINGDVSGTLSYTAAIAGLGAEITMHYENYCDFYIGSEKELGSYFVLTGNTDTTSNMSANGNMHETVQCTGMYPGYAVYDNLEIKSGAAGGGYYLVQTKDLSGNVLLAEGQVDWKVGEEH